MAAQVEREVLLVQEDRCVVVVLASCGELLECGVGARDVGGVVLGVVKLVDLARDVRLEGGVIVIKIGQGVLGHVVPFSNDAVPIV